MANPKYHFFSCVRKGIVNEMGDLHNGRPIVNVSFSLFSSENETPVYTSSVSNNTIQLHAPLDVLGYNTDKLQVRVEPKPNIGDFEPNYFPFIEYSAADFLWRFTPEKIEETGKGLTPWLTLIVLKVGEGSEKAEFIPGDITPDELPNYITIKEASPLPDLTTLWKWAHVQVTTNGESGTDIQQALSNPLQTVGRLMCPRHLEPGVKYCAFVVPTYKHGLQRGLGDSISGVATALSWVGDSANSEFRIPYYYKWEFRTGLRGDYEYLVRLLEPRKISKLGTRQVDCSKPGYALDNKINYSKTTNDENGQETTIKNLEFESALLSMDTEVSVWGYDKKDNPLDEGEKTNAFQKGINDLLNTSDDGDLKVLPPIYGKWHAYEETPSPILDKDNDEAPWLHQLNTDPRHRFVVGLGVEIVKENQEDFMAKAWEQIGNLKTFNQSIDKEQFNHHLLRKLHGRLKNLPITSLINITNPVTPRMRSEGNQNINESIRGQLHNSAIPNALLDATARKIFRKNGAIRQTQIKLNGLKQGEVFERLEGVVFDGGEKAHIIMEDVATPGGLNVLPEIPQELTGNIVFSERLAQLSRITPLRATVQQNLLPQEEIIKLDDSKVLVAYRIPLELKKGRKSSQTHNVFINLNEKRSGREFTVTPKNNIKEILRTNNKGITSKRLLGDFTFNSNSFSVKNDELLIFDYYEYGLGSINGTLKNKNGDVLKNAQIKLPESIGEGVRVDSKGGFKLSDVTAGVHEVVVIHENGQQMRTHVTVEAGESIFTDIQFAPNEKPRINQLLRALSAGAFENKPEIEQLQAVNLADITETVLKKIDPAHMIMAPLQTKISGFIDTYGNLLKRKQEEEKVNHIMAHPEFMLPTYEYLRDKSQDYILSGLEKVPQNTVMLLKTNRRFIEAYMLGLNHEFASELLWRDYPTDMRGTYFQQFWDEAEEEVADEEQKDIDEIVNWNEGLGKNEEEFNDRSRPVHENSDGTDEENAVLLIRGDLLKKYPNTLIYILKATTKDNEPYPEFDGDDPKFPMLPIFDGTLPPDVTFLGFQISPTEIRTEAPGYFIVFEERVSETRFGLDINKPESTEPHEIDDLSWEHFPDTIIVNDTDNVHTYLNNRKPIGINGWPTGINGNLTDPSSAEMASFTYQKPVRVMIHASKLIPENPEIEQ